MGQALLPDERVAVGNYLAVHHVPREKLKFYQYWIDLYLRHRRVPGVSGCDPQEVQEFLDAIGRVKAPWQVKQAGEAVRLFLYYRASQPYAPAADRPAAESAPGPSTEDVLRWDAITAEMRRIIRVRQLSPQTEKSYLAHVRQFRRWHNERPPQDVTSADVRNYLSFLAVERQVSAVTQNQAFNALLFFLRHALGRNPTDLNGSVRAPVRRRLPVVLTSGEIARIAAQMPRMSALMARMIYGCGLRLRECLLLRIKDVDFDRGVLTVRAGKGNKDRQTVLPSSLRADWERHLEKVRRLYDRDRLRCLPGVELPYALERKYPNAGREWAWYWAFPGLTLLPDPRSGVVRRPGFNPNTFRQHFHHARRAAAIAKFVTVHALRHNAELRIMPNGSCMLNTIPLQAA